HAGRRGGAASTACSLPRKWGGDAVAPPLATRTMSLCLLLRCVHAAALSQRRAERGAHSLSLLLSSSLPLDVRFACDVRVVIELLLEHGAEGRSAPHRGKQPLLRELGLHLLRLHRRGEPGGQLRQYVGWRLRRRNDAVENLRLVLDHAGLVERR